MFVFLWFFPRFVTFYHALSCDMRRKCLSPTLKRHTWQILLPPWDVSHSAIHTLAQMPLCWAGRRLVGNASFIASDSSSLLLFYSVNQSAKLPLPTRQCCPEYPWAACVVQHASHLCVRLRLIWSPTTLKTFCHWSQGMSSPILCQIAPHSLLLYGHCIAPADTTVSMTCQLFFSCRIPRLCWAYLHA